VCRAFTESSLSNSIFAPYTYTSLEIPTILGVLSHAIDVGVNRHSSYVSETCTSMPAETKSSEMKF
jgi:hypothetical protein